MELKISLTRARFDIAAAVSACTQTKLYERRSGRNEIRFQSFVCARAYVYIYICINIGRNPRRLDRL